MTDAEPIIQTVDATIAHSRAMIDQSRALIDQSRGLMAVSPVRQRQRPGERERLQRPFAWPLFDAEARPCQSAPNDRRHR